MGFSETVKVEAKRRSAFRCCIDQKPFVEVHHILPESEGGPDTIENAAPLCASCHDLFGGNPEKRKQIRQMRDDWWERVAKLPREIAASMEVTDNEFFNENPNAIRQLRNEIALYHCVFADEDFTKSSQILLELVNESQKKYPDQRRHLFLDIEGHRNNVGEFDHDMFELQRHFIMGFLRPYLSAVNIPLLVASNNKLQRNDVPEMLLVNPPGTAGFEIPEGTRLDGIYLADHDTFYTAE